jgi:hypothetical protein
MQNASTIHSWYIYESNAAEMLCVCMNTQRTYISASTPRQGELLVCLAVGRCGKYAWSGGCVIMKRREGVFCRLSRNSSVAFGAEASMFPFSLGSLVYSIIWAGCSGLKGVIVKLFMHFCMSGWCRE